MKIPKSIMVGVHRVKIDKVDHIEAVIPDPSEMCFGMAYTGNNLIELKTGQDEKKEAEHFLHEITHFADSHAGTGMTENQVRGLSTVLFMIMRRNKLDFSGGK